MKNNKIKIPKKILDKEENFISTEEAYKDVITAEWDEMVVKEEKTNYKKVKYNKNKKDKSKLQKVDEYILNEKTIMELEYDFITSLVDTRKKEKLTQQEIADKINIFREGIARIETNKVSPQLGTIIKILYSMGYKLDIVPIKKNK